MNYTQALYPTAPIGLQAEANFVTAWLRGQGISEGDCHLLIGYFTLTYLLSLPKPKWKFRVGNFTVVKRARHLWYWKAASVFSWIEQRQFPQEIRFILNKVYADSAGDIKFNHATIVCSCPSSKVKACRENDGVRGPLLTRVVESREGGGSTGPPCLGGRCGKHDKIATIETKVSSKGAKG